MDGTYNGCNLGWCMECCFSNNISIKYSSLFLKYHTIKIIYIYLINMKIKKVILLVQIYKIYKIIF